MIEYDKVVIPENPSECEEAIRLLGCVFGEAEGRLESKQLDGGELLFNTDVLFTAKEGGMMLGTCHLTIPRSFATLGALSGLCTSKEARGRGIGRNLFRMAVEDADERGVETLFLGTSNPLAAGMYMQFGFSFVTGSNVMVRYNGKALLDYYQKYYYPAPVSCVSGDASFRIPIIPLVLSRGRDFLMDANTAIFSSAVVTQSSCMGLFPRYLALAADGGSYFGACHPSGALCAMSSMLPVRDGTRVDAFALPGFESELPGLLSCCMESVDDAFAQIAIADSAKEAMFAAIGFEPGAFETYSAGAFAVPCRIWR